MTSAGDKRTRAEGVRSGPVRGKGRLPGPWEKAAGEEGACRVRGKRLRGSCPWERASLGKGSRSDPRERAPLWRGRLSGPRPGAAYFCSRQVLDLPAQPPPQRLDRFP